MNEGINISLAISLLSSLFLSLPPYVDTPWEGGGAILGTTPLPRGFNLRRERERERERKRDDKRERTIFLSSFTPHKGLI